jgi:hypothetical protein
VLRRRIFRRRQAAAADKDGASGKIFSRHPCELSHGIRMSGSCVKIILHAKLQFYRAELRDFQALKAAVFVRKE